MYWAQHLQEFSLSAEPLKSLSRKAVLPCTVTKNLWCRGHFFSDVLHCRTGKSGKSAGLLIPATLTAMLVELPNRWNYLPVHFTVAVCGTRRAGGLNVDRNVSLGVVGNMAEV
ncbi:PTS system alpha-glucoside-specific EIICB component [Escherichia coli]|uniref:PTS system alpha-glucoside-specific EIICB component n=1 Tax=Escherichia coli TaxID=562 RepID=A0A376WRH6_ECOLX|nr:PTS system alpha-glucoside-specific EIICB component [Escherichia coli]